MTSENIYWTPEVLSFSIYVAKWIAYVTVDREVLGSIPGLEQNSVVGILYNNKKFLITARIWKLGFHIHV